MNDTDKEERIRARAYTLWEQEGRPEGRQGEHWDQARREVDEESSAQLSSSVTDSIGLAVGSEPEKPRRRSRPAQESPAEGDRGTINRELNRQSEAPERPARRRKESAG